MQTSPARHMVLPQVTPTGGPGFGSDGDEDGEGDGVGGGGGGAARMTLSRKKYRKINIETIKTNFFTETIILCIG